MCVVVVLVVGGGMMIAPGTGAVQCWSYAILPHNVNDGADENIAGKGCVCVCVCVVGVVFVVPVADLWWLVGWLVGGGDQ